jgi:hypothetical protein
VVGYTAELLAESMIADGGMLTGNVILTSLVSVCVDEIGFAGLGYEDDVVVRTFYVGRRSHFQREGRLTTYLRYPGDWESLPKVFLSSTVVDGISELKQDDGTQGTRSSHVSVPGRATRWDQARHRRLSLAIVDKV